MKPVLLVAALAFTFALAAVAGISLNRGGAQAQDAVWPAPANVRAADGANPGEVVVSWDAVAGAPFYRIGWVAYDDIDAARAAGRNWLDAFAFSDVANLGQTSHTVKNLAPCVRYAFIAASLSRRFGDASWSDWALLTPGDGNDPCPAAAATGTPTPTPRLAPPPTLTPRPTPTGPVDYDADQDGLIEVSGLAQLAAIRADLNGDGVSPAPAYAAAFPNAMPGMGCPDAGCAGYELIANLDFDTNGNGAADAGDAHWNNGAGWFPIGDGAHAFTADFDGNNHTIANLYINRSDTVNVGLFGAVSDSSIKRVGLVSAAVSGKIGVGSLVGHIYRGIISASYATGSVSGVGRVGGLVGESSDGVISASYAAGSVSGVGRVGGLVGESRRGTIVASYATGSVTGDNGVGGLVGYGYKGIISTSYATGTVSGNENVGGLVGERDGSISASYATGSVSGVNFVGGLAGHSGVGSISGSYATGSVSGNARVGGLVGDSAHNNISASYATGSVSGNNYVGGLVGSDGHHRDYELGLTFVGGGSTIIASYATGAVSGHTRVGGLVGMSGRGTITASYATSNVLGNHGHRVGGLVGWDRGGVTITASYAAGRISARLSISGDTSAVGGLIGFGGHGTIIASYWDTETSGQAGSYGGVGKTSAELQSPAGYAGIYAGWNLDLNDDSISDDPWHFCNSGQYPALQYGSLDPAAQRR